MKLISGKNARILIRILRIAPIFIMIAGAALILLLNGSISANSIINMSPADKWAAAFTLILMFGVKSLIVFFPIAALYTAVGIIFSWPVAMLINIVGTLVCFSIPYTIGRFSGSPIAESLPSRYRKLYSLRNSTLKNDWFFAYIVRTIPILPGDIISIYMGSIKFSYGKMMIGGIIGIMPTLAAVTILGAKITEPHSPAFFTALSVMLIITAVSVFIYIIYTKKKGKDIEKNS